MTDALPIRRTLTFQNDLKSLIPKNERKNLLFDIEHISKDDLSRFHLLKSKMLKPFRSYHKGQNRLFFIYCHQCYHEYNKKPNCEGCDENDLEKLVFCMIDHRSNAYRYNKASLTDFKLWDP
ncbi:hypothetical protein ES705_42093 [subsurface metagenome]